MGVLKIEMLGSEVLRKPATEVQEIDESLRLLIADMYLTMYAAEGIGLAGPQVGVSKRVIVVDVTEEGGGLGKLALVNPRIVEVEQGDGKGRGGVPEHPRRLRGRGAAGASGRRGHGRARQPVRIEAEGLLARCLQHEMDHLRRACSSSTAFRR